jgi:hypothetical protein
MLYAPEWGPVRIPEIDPMVAMRPFDATMRGLNALVTRYGP